MTKVYTRLLSVIVLTLPPHVCSNTAVLYCIVQYCAVLCCIVHSIVQYCTVLYSIVQYCIVLYSIVQYCTLLYTNTIPTLPFYRCVVI